MTREQATTIRDHAIMKWEAIAADYPTPPMLKWRYFRGCSMCSAFATIEHNVVIDCGKCPLDCTKVGSNFYNWLDRKSKKRALAVLEQIKAITIEQLMEAGNDKRVG